MHQCMPAFSKPLFDGSAAHTTKFRTKKYRFFATSPPGTRKLSNFYTVGNGAGSIKQTTFQAPALLFPLHLRNIYTAIISFQFVYKKHKERCRAHQTAYIRKMDFISPHHSCTDKKIRIERPCKIKAQDPFLF